MDRERFKKQIDFVLEIDKEKNILRQTHLTDYRRQASVSVSSQAAKQILSEVFHLQTIKSVYLDPN